MCVVINNSSYPAVKNNNTAYRAFGKYWMQARGFLNYRLKYCWPKVFCCMSRFWMGDYEKTGGANRGPSKNLGGGHCHPGPPLRIATGYYTPLVGHEWYAGSNCACLRGPHRCFRRECCTGGQSMINTAREPYSLHPSINAKHGVGQVATALLQVFSMTLPGIDLRLQTLLGHSQPTVPSHKTNILTLVL